MTEEIVVVMVAMIAVRRRVLTTESGEGVASPKKPGTRVGSPGPRGRYFDFGGTTSGAPTFTRPSGRGL